MNSFLDFNTYSKLIYYLDFFGIHLLIIYAGLIILSEYKNKIADYVVCVMFAIGLSESLKALFNIPRPTETLLNMTFFGYSFPSTHTSISFAIAFYCILSYLKIKNPSEELQLKMRLSLPIVALMAIFISILRILIGAHFTIDVVGGIIVGFISAYVIKNYDILVRKVS